MQADTTVSSEKCSYVVIVFGSYMVRQGGPIAFPFNSLNKIEFGIDNTSKNLIVTSDGYFYSLFMV
jgi:hypothetical protein